jgi:NADH dehydrogenase (ubiquinone) Fe-S protein 6
MRAPSQSPSHISEPVEACRTCCYAHWMNDTPETVTVKSRRVSCDGASDIPGGAALGHPRVFLEIDEKGYVECGYCDRRFILAGGIPDAAH